MQEINRRQNRNGKPQQCFLVTTDFFLSFFFFALYLYIFVGAASNGWKLKNFSNTATNKSNKMHRMHMQLLPLRLLHECANVLYSCVCAKFSFDCSFRLVWNKGKVLCTRCTHVSFSCNLQHRTVLNAPKPRTTHAYLTLGFPIESTQRILMDGRLCAFAVSHDLRPYTHSPYERRVAVQL